MSSKQTAGSGEEIRVVEEADAESCENDADFRALAHVRTGYQTLLDEMRKTRGPVRGYARNLS